MNFSVTTRLEPRTVEFRKPIADPFVRHTVHVGFWDLVRAVFRRRLAVTMIIDADKETIFRVMNLDRAVFPRMDSTTTSNTWTRCFGVLDNGGRCTQPLNHEGTCT